MTRSYTHIRFLYDFRDKLEKELESLINNEWELISPVTPVIESDMLFCFCTIRKTERIVEGDQIG